MKLINQSFEILEQKDFTITGIKKFIEKCGRVCYKSEDRITDTSYEKFVGMLESRGHDRPLEFGTVHLKMPWKTFNNFAGFCVSKGFWDSCWIKYNIDRESEDKMVYITTNYRYYKKLGTLKPLYGYIDIEEFFTEEDNKFYPKRYTVHFITSRGIMDEFRTHVGLSHLAESSRYCSYDKNRFGNELTFIIPNWVNTNCPNKEQEGPSVASIEWSTTMLDAEASYMNLIKMGCTAQEAREVLPLAVKSELISCGFEDVWSNFFYRRCAKDAHPMAREIATKVRDKFKELNYVNQ
jgi:thymidylate synthase (FAD)|nr:MAG TPA: Thymidylate synthase complementing protein [Crassvirales sp.]